MWIALQRLAELRDVALFPRSALLGTAPGWVLGGCSGASSGATVLGCSLAGFPPPFSYDSLFAFSPLEPICMVSYFLTPFWVNRKNPEENPAVV